MADNSSKTTTDHDEIRKWADARGGKPAAVDGTGGNDDVGLIRIEFPDDFNSDSGKLSEISWDDFFEKFEEGKLALIYQDQTAGGDKSKFNKLVKRD
jgi:hypothetical protein